jgi:hypothetical protein
MGQTLKKIELNVHGNSETTRLCTMTSSLTNNSGGLVPSFVYLTAATSGINNLMVDFDAWNVPELTL